VFELDDVLAAGVFFGDPIPGAVVEDIAVLQNFDEGGTLVSGGGAQGVFQWAWKMSTERATKVASAPMAREMG